MVSITAFKSEKIINGLKRKDEKCLDAFNRVLDYNIANLEKEIKSILSYDSVDYVLDDYRNQALSREAEHRTYSSLISAIKMLSELDKINFEEERTLEYLVDKRITELHERYFEDI